MIETRSALAICLALGLANAPARSMEPVLEGVVVGIDGHYKHGHWAEVRASVRAGDASLQGQLEVTSRDGDAVPVTFVGPRFDLAANHQTEISTLVKMGPPRSGLQIKIRGHGGESLALATLPQRSIGTAHDSTTQVVVTLGPPAGVDSATELLRRVNADDLAALQLRDARQLPTLQRGYDAIDTLVVVVSDSNPLAGLDDARRDALLEWLRLGGHLVLVCGETTGELLDPAGPWSVLAPGKVTGRVPLENEGGLRTITGESLSLEEPPQVVRLETPSRFVTLGDNGTSTDRPLIVEWPLGMGRVSLLLVDVSQPPLADWSGRSRLMARLITSDSSNLARSETRRNSGGRVTHHGYRDLAGQLRSALDQYPGVSPVHFYTVAGLLLIYLLLLGPGEYFLLRRSAPMAMHLTWVVFPLLVVGFVAGAMALARFSRGGELRVNQLELVDLDLTQGRQRGTLWMGMFSPQATSYSLTMRPSLAIPQTKVDESELSWQALPGSGLGGIDAPPLTSAFREPYNLVPGAGLKPAEVEQLPLTLGSSKMLAGSWSGTIAPAPEASRLRRGKSRDLEGDFTVVAPVTLSNVYLAHGEWLYRARDEVNAGTTLSIDQLDRRHLETQLSQQRILTGKELAAPWNQEETNPLRILDIMMFHDAVRGRNYTVLSHRYQPELDLSHLIRRGYAVLVGRSATPLTEIDIDDKPLESAAVRRWTVYRIIYPVAAAEE